MTVIALYEYEADDDDEISFEAGDEIIQMGEPSEEGMRTRL